MNGCVARLTNRRVSDGCSRSVYEFNVYVGVLKANLCSRHATVRIRSVSTHVSDTESILGVRLRTF